MRVQFRCSKPSCDVVTVGPHTDEARSINVGVAAHITAAAPLGPRYDPTLTQAERSSSTNGIWLCATHAREIDTDESAFPVELLFQWKDVAEREAGHLVVSRLPPQPTSLREAARTYLERLITGYSQDPPTSRVIPGFQLQASIFENRQVQMSEGTRRRVTRLSDLLPLHGENKPKHRVLAIEGRVGDGKTAIAIQTSVSLSTEAARALEDPTKDVLLPVLLELPNIVDGRRLTFEESISQKLGPELVAAIQAQTSSPRIRVALIVDGLDQDPQFVASDSLAFSRALAQKWLGLVVICARRGATAPLESELSGIIQQPGSPAELYAPTVAQLQPLTQSQLDQLVHALGRAVGETDLMVRVQHLLSELEDSLHERIDSPLTVLTLARLLLNSPDSTTEFQRGSLFDSLYSRWLLDEERRFERLHPGRGQSFRSQIDTRLGGLADDYLTAGAVGFTEFELRSVLPTEDATNVDEWLVHLQAGGMLYRDGPTGAPWRFSHSALAEEAWLRNLKRGASPHTRPLARLIDAFGHDGSDQNLDAGAHDYLFLPRDAARWLSVLRTLLVSIDEPERSSTLTGMAAALGEQSISRWQRSHAWRCLLWLSAQIGGTQSPPVIEYCREVLRENLKHLDDCAICELPMGVHLDELDAFSIATFVEAGGSSDDVCASCRHELPDVDPDRLRLASYVLRVAALSDELPSHAALALKSSSPHLGLLPGGLAWFLTKADVWRNASAARIELLATQGTTAPILALHIDDDDLTDMLFERCPRATQQLLAQSLPPLLVGGRNFADLATSSRQHVASFGRRWIESVNAFGLSAEGVSALAGHIDIGRSLIEGDGPWERAVDVLDDYLSVMRQEDTAWMRIETRPSLRSIVLDVALPPITRVFAALCCLSDDGAADALLDSTYDLVESPSERVAPTGTANVFARDTEHWLRTGPMHFTIPHRIAEADGATIPPEVVTDQLQVCSAFSTWSYRSPTPIDILAGVCGLKTDEPLSLLATRAFAVRRFLHDYDAVKLAAAVRKLVQTRNALPCFIDTLIAERVLVSAGYSEHHFIVTKALRRSRPIHMPDLLVEPDDWPPAREVWRRDFKRAFPNVPLLNPWTNWRSPSVLV